MEMNLHLFSADDRTDQQQMLQPQALELSEEELAEVNGASGGGDGDYYRRRYHHHRHCYRYWDWYSHCYRWFCDYDYE
jgi:hypothetical protein